MFNIIQITDNNYKIKIKRGFNMLIIFFRTILLYALIIFSIRIMGKRQLGDLQPSELAITILISNIATMSIDEPDISLIFSAVPILTLVGFELILSKLSLRYKPFRSFISGSPVVIIKDGQIIQKRMRDLRLSIDDLMEALRGNNIFDIQDVDYAIVETNGKISVFQDIKKQAVNPSQLKLDVKKECIPKIIISDGILLKKSLKIYKISEDIILEKLKSKNLKTKDIFIMTITEDNKYFIVPRDKKKR